MKKSILFLLFLSVSLSVIAQQKWQQELIDFGEDNLFPYEDISRTDDGIVLITEQTIVEINERGELMFDYNVPNYTMSLSQSTFIERVPDGYIVVSRSGGSTFKIVIQKINLDNQVAYTRIFNITGGINTQKKYPAGVLDFSNQQLFLATIDSVFIIDASTGQVLSRKGGSGIYSDGIQVGNTFVATTTAGDISEYDNTGDLNWSVSFNNFTFNCVDQTDANGFIAGGTDTNGDAIVEFTDGTGGHINSYTFGAGVINDIKKTNGDNYVLAGENNGQSFLIKIDGSGNIIWQENFGVGKEQKVEVSNDGGFYFYQREPNMLIKTDVDGKTSNNITRRYTEGSEALDISNISALFNADGNLFAKGLTSHFEAPKGSGVNSIYNAGLWISGYDPGGNLHLGVAEFVPGLDGCIADEFLKVWKINRKDLIAFKNDIADGIADSSIPHHILTYPAKGNPNFRGRFDKFYDITKNAAPFVDINGDGIYNALDGDYPVMKGDQMVVWLMNDNQAQNPTMTLPLKVDIVATAYSYDCADNSEINNNVFIKHDIINQSVEDYSNVKVGIFNDFDLGCFTDDFVGIDTMSNTTYAYNDNATDGLGGCGNITTYGTNIPVQSMTILNKDISAHSYWVNGSWSLPFPPTTGIQYDYLLEGRWADGSPITANGNGYLTSGTITKFAFPSNPSDANGWSMCSNLLPGSDLRSLASSEIGSFPVGNILSFEMVYSTHEGITYPCPDINTEVIPTITSIQDYYDNDELDWELNLGEDRTIDAGSTLTLDPMYTNGTNYSWSTGATTSTIDVSSPGIYTVTVTHSNGCKKTEEVNITAFTSTSEIVEPIKAQIFPNPVSNQLTIDFEITDLNSDLTFEIVNVLGQVLKTKTVNLQEGQVIFDVNDLANGIYIVNIKSDTQFLKTEKVIKQ